MFLLRRVEFAAGHMVVEDQRYHMESAFGEHIPENGWTFDRHVKLARYM